MVKVLVVRDSNTKFVFAHVVPRKGVSEDAYAVDMLVADVMWLGYSRVILKSDNEPSIKTLLGVALRALKVSEVAQVMEESPPPYDSQAVALRLELNLYVAWFARLRVALKNRSR